MTPPWLDLGYDTKLTYGLPDDADHRIEVRRQGAPATARPLVLPADGMRGERARRWRRLARAAVIAEQDPDREALLPAAGPPRSLCQADRARDRRHLPVPAAHHRLLRRALTS
jgi:hypothetical protein